MESAAHGPDILRQLERQLADAWREEAPLERIQQIEREIDAVKGEPGQ